MNSVIVIVQIKRINIKNMKMKMIPGQLNPLFYLDTVVVQAKRKKKMMKKKKKKKKKLNLLLKKNQKLKNLIDLMNYYMHMELIMYMKLKKLMLIMIIRVYLKKKKIKKFQEIWL